VEFPHTSIFAGQCEWERIERGPPYPCQAGCCKSCNGHSGTQQMISISLCLNSTNFRYLPSIAHHQSERINVAPGCIAQNRSVRPLYDLAQYIGTLFSYTFMRDSAVEVHVFLVEMQRLPIDRPNAPKIWSTNGPASLHRPVENVHTPRTLRGECCPSVVLTDQHTRTSTFRVKDRARINQWV